MPSPRTGLPSGLKHPFSGRADAALETTRLRLPARHRLALEVGDILKVGRLNVRDELHIARDIPIDDPICIALYPVEAFDAAAERLQARNQQLRSAGTRALDYLLDEFEDCLLQANYRVELASFLKADASGRSTVSVLGRRSHLLVVSTETADLVAARREHDRADATQLISGLFGGTWDQDD